MRIIIDAFFLLSFLNTRELNRIKREVWTVGYVAGKEVKIGKEKYDRKAYTHAGYLGVSEGERAEQTRRERGVVLITSEVTSWTVTAPGFIFFNILGKPGVIEEFDEHRN